MTPLRVLMIGGTGNISSAVAREEVRSGMDLTIVTRGNSATRPVIEGVRHIVADSSDADAMAKAIGESSYDCVVNWIAFTAETVDRDIRLFRDRTRQYIFISSASAYQTPPRSVPIRESSPLQNPFWLYSRNKIAAEDQLLSAYRDAAFPMTIVRPSHTYDETWAWACSDGAYATHPRRIPVLDVRCGAANTGGGAEVRPNLRESVHVFSRSELYQ